MDQAERATSALLNATTPELRKRVLKRYEGLWSDVKDDLAELSNGKCWYCEVRQVRSYMTVDHFRPKGRVRGVTPVHDGYWWLAFVVENYRFACTFCNSPSRDEFGKVRGKRDYFPIADEGTRVRSESLSTDGEVVMLLDPTKYLDPPLLFLIRTDTFGPIRGCVRPVRCGWSALR